MNIFTSYFAQTTKLRAVGIEPIGIALYPPRFFKGSSIQWLAPKSFMLKGITNEEYTKLYKELILDKIDLNVLRDTFSRFSKGGDIALCCFEKPGDFCHRHLFAEWLEEKTGYKVEEFTTVKEEKKPEPVQSSMF